jgi:hypothetical protein
VSGGIREASLVVVDRRPSASSGTSVCSYIILCAFLVESGNFNGRGLHRPLKGKDGTHRLGAFSLTSRIISLLKLLPADSNIT